LGRDGTNKYLEAVPAYFTIGLMDETTYVDAQPIVQGAYQSVSVTPGTAEARGGGSDAWTPVTLNNTGGDPDRNRLADVNGNGRLDAIVGFEAISIPGKLAWYEQGVNVNDSWTEHIISDSIIGPMSLDVADMDNDNDFDVVVGEHNTANPQTAKLFVFENASGNGVDWTSHLVYTGDEHHDGAQVVDIDGDGDKDIISIGWTHGRVLLYENLANPTNPPGPTPTPIPGVTPTPSPPPPPRVDDGLQVLYTFREETGDVIHDVSEVGAPLDLVIGDGSPSWLPGGGLSVQNSAQISSGEAASKIINACQATNELTVEAWLQLSSASQGSPARIVSLSDGAMDRNFTLGHGDDNTGSPANQFAMRLRTSATETDDNGKPALSSAAGAASTNLTHVVYTFANKGDATIYINGAENTTTAVGGDLSNWNPNYPLLLANESTGDRPWTGQLYLVAVYCRALTGVEVEQNYKAGELPVDYDEFNYLPTIIRTSGSAAASSDPLWLRIETFFADVANWVAEQFE
jgi:hypothetical protein